MSNLISREDAIAKFKKSCTSESIDKNGIKRGEIHTAMTYEGIIKIIESLPSAEPKQKKGKWQRRKDEDCWECSECHAVLENSDVGNHNYYYCYHCGANMMDICGYMDLEKANYE